MPRGTILLAEDNHDDEVLTVRALSKQLAGVEIVVAHNGVEVMDYLCGTGAYVGRNTGDLPKVLLLDLKMPLMDGLETLKRIRATEHTRFLPVVILTSSDEQRDRIESYRFGANSYVRKPIKFDAFLEAAGQLGIYWLNVNQSPPAPPRAAATQ
jgi:two-component system response regulator